MELNYLAIVQARFNSTRLPGKVLLEVFGKSFLEHQIARIKLAKKIDKIVIATSTEKSDEKIYELGKSIGVDVFRGSLENVLDRFFHATNLFPSKNIIRLTADCPLIDWEKIDELIEFFEEGNFDYASNALEPTLPDGLDAEVFKSSVLKKTWREASLNSEKEHVTPYIHSHPEMFSIGKKKYYEDHSDLRWTLDEPEDLELITKIYEHFYPMNCYFGYEDILNFLETRPDLKSINLKIKRNEGFEKSLMNDNK